MPNRNDCLSNNDIGGLNCPLISVIIPIYNAEKYLNYCLNSFCKQTFKDFEILMIDDGSLDNSVSICEKYISKDERFKLIRQKNQGVCSARNNGIKHAKGKYIVFCDNDDWYTEDGLQNLYESIETNNSDLACGSIYLLWPHTNTYERKSDKVYCLNSNISELIEINNIGSAVWGNIYKNEIVKKHNIKFLDVKIREDSIFFYDYLYHCERINTISNVVYTYNKLENNTGCSKYYPTCNECNYINCLNRFKAIEKFAQSSLELDSIKASIASSHYIDSIKEYLLANLTKEEKVVKLVETTNMYSKIVNFKKIDEESKNILKIDISEYITSNNYELLIKKYNEKNNSIINKLNKDITNIVKKIFYCLKSKRYLNV